MTKTFFLFSISLSFFYCLMLHRVCMILCNKTYVYLRMMSFFVVIILLPLYMSFILSVYLLHLQHDKQTRLYFLSFQFLFLYLYFLRITFSLCVSRSLALSFHFNVHLLFCVSVVGHHSKFDTAAT